MAQQFLTVAIEQTTVVLLLDGRRLLAMPWQTADEIHRAIRAQVRAARSPLADTVNTEIGVLSGAHVLSIRQEGGKVLIIGNGRLLVDMAPSVAERLWRGILVQARRAEEIAKADSIAFDQALLMRTGAPFGLTSHPKIQAAAMVEAGHNRTLRRAIPGVRSREVFGMPGVYHAPPAFDQLRGMLARMSPEQRRAVLRGN